MRSAFWELVRVSATDLAQSFHEQFGSPTKFNGRDTFPDFSPVSLKFAMAEVASVGNSCLPESLPTVAEMLEDIQRLGGPSHAPPSDLLTRYSGTSSFLEELCFACIFSPVFISMTIPERSETKTMK